MQSLRSKIVIGLLKKRHFFKFKLKQETIDEKFSVTNYRESIEKISSKINLPKGIGSERIVINNNNAEWIFPENYRKGKVLLYIHGGGFISGSCTTHRMHVAKFAKISKTKALVFDYSLAPENPFPAGLNDCIDVYKWLLDKGYSGSDIVVGGESAGGTLTLSLLLALKEYNLPMPSGAFSISPVTDLRCLANSFIYNAKNDLAPQGSWDLWTSFYIGNNNPMNPLLSPLFGNYKDLPPIFICVGTNEIHLEDCENVAKVAESYGVNVTLRKWDKMVHAFPILTGLFPEATKAMKEICDFVENRLG